jgi:5-bromo-4-chloroindolyl phosphate hydrolysis protein
MSLRPCTLLLMEDLSSSNDPDLNELLDDDIEQMVMLLATNELEDRRNKRRLGSKVGRLFIP